MIEGLSLAKQNLAANSSATWCHSADSVAGSAMKTLITTEHHARKLLIDQLNIDVVKSPRPGSRLSIVCWYPCYDSAYQEFLHLSPTCRGV